MFIWSPLKCLGKNQGEMMRLALRNIDHPGGCAPSLKRCAISLGNVRASRKGVRGATPFIYFVFKQPERLKIPCFYQICLDFWNIDFPGKRLVNWGVCDYYKGRAGNYSPNLTPCDFTIEPFFSYSRLPLSDRAPRIRSACSGPEYV